MEDAEAMLAEQQKKLDERRRELADLAQQVLDRPDERAEIPQDIAAGNAQIESLRREPPEAGLELPREFADAPELLRTIKLEVAQSQIETTNRKREYLEATSELLPLQREKANREVTLLDKTVAQWTNHAAQLRQQAVDKQSDAATKSQSRVDKELKELKELAATNAKLAAEWTSVAKDFELAREAEIATTNRYDKLKAEFTYIRTLLKSRGHVSEAFGGMLRTNRKTLPDLRKHRRLSVERKTKKYDVEFAQISTSDQLAEFGNTEDRLNAELAELAKTVGEARLNKLTPQVRKLLDERKKTLEGLNANYEDYATTLEKLDVTEDQLIDLTERYAAFVDERVLWIRSTPPAALSDFRDGVKAVQWLTWDRFRNVGSEFGKTLFERLVANLACAIGFLGLLTYRLRYRGHINELGRQAAARNCRDFSITLEVLAYTAARAATWPLVFLWFAWNLSHLDSDIEFAHPLSSALQIVASLSYPILFWWRAVRVHGLAEAHLDWSTQKRQVTERSLRIVLPVILPAIAFFQFYSASDKQVYEKSVGRLCFVVATICIAWCVSNLTSPKNGIFAHYLNKHRDQWFDQLKSIWYPAMILIPLSIGVLALMGYQYTAAELLRRFYISAAFLSGLYLLAAVCLRWLLINRRRLAMQQARERLAEFQQQLKARSESNEDSEPGQSAISETMDGVVESAHIDLSQVSLQSKRLLGSFTTMSALIGLYLIWIAVLPALAKLDDYQLWRTAVEVSTFSDVNGSASAADGSEIVESTVRTIRWITLGNVITALVIVVMTIVAVQNIPGLLEIALLQRLPIDMSIRYAITTVTRYLIIIVGVAMAFSRIGIGWSKVQFLAAAISVGLGFGLQEIFANFMSGLILLFERPLRAGDIVTVGDVSGQVVQIRTRATTVRDWDYKELIVPNKEFITGKVLNWTLSDTVNRIVVNVGIAYGTNIKLARQIVLDAAADHPTITDTPSPSVTFGSFGDSTLDFTLRCYVPNIDNRLSVVHELHETIHDRLGEAGIEIAFPQRDVNVRSIPESVIHQMAGQNRPKS
ncbi:mechanosensitive ion channel domain-containing protein [Planctomycetota bacterium]